jgi:putative ABC transport system permease protein
MHSTRALGLGLIAPAFALLALVLAAIGVYGVMAFHVLQRTREVGVRLALGASPGDVLKLVVGQGMRLVLVGLGAGLVAAFVLSRSMASLLYGISPRDLAVYSLASLVLGVLGLAACYIPARRAMRVDPVVALRAE